MKHKSHGELDIQKKNAHRKGGGEKANGFFHFLDKVPPAYGNKMGEPF